MAVYYQTAVLVVLSIVAGASLVFRSNSRQYHPISTIRNVSLATSSSALPFEINVVNQQQRDGNDSSNTNSSSESQVLLNHTTNTIHKCMVQNAVNMLDCMTANNAHNTSTSHPPPANNNNTNVTNSSRFPRLSIVVTFAGELGNHLSRIAHGFALQQWAREYYGLETDLVFDGRHYRTNMMGTECFPNLRQFNFHGITGRDLNFFLEQQKSWFGDKNHPLHKSLQLTTLTEETIRQGLSTLRNVSHWTNRTDVRSAGTAITTTNVTLPFLVVLGDVVAVDVLTDKYYEDFRRLFAFEDETCCKLKPDPDETVLHFRNFAAEMGQDKAHGKGFSELDPLDTAHQLLGHLQPGDKVAITSRYANHRSVQPYVDALTNRSLQVRVITGQSGIEDFCFLRHTKKELVGVAESTFALWAAYLSNATRVLLYSIDSGYRRSSKLGQLHLFVHYNWTNPSLRDKVHFKLIQLDRTT